MKTKECSCMWCVHEREGGPEPGGNGRERGKVSVVSDVECFSRLKMVA